MVRNCRCSGRTGTAFAAASGTAPGFAPVAGATSFPHPTTSIESAKNTAAIVDRCMAEVAAPRPQTRATPNGTRTGARDARAPNLTNS